MPVGIKIHPKKPRSENKDNPQKHQDRRKRSGVGSTGKSLVEQIQTRLTRSLTDDRPCDLILVFDDLDCRDADVQTEEFKAAIDTIKDAEKLDRVIGFAAPEIESWIVADWDHVMGQYTKFKSSSVEMKLWLRQNHTLSFDRPEEFSQYDSQKDCCQEKLSAAIQECTREVAHEYYSKDTDTSELIKRLNPIAVKQKCPFFRKFYDKLSSS